MKRAYTVSDASSLDKVDYSTATEARKMLDMLDCNGAFTFQTFADRKDSTANLARVFHGTLNSCSANLQDLNKQGAGVFVTINKTDLKGRARNNVTDIRALFIDFDKVNPERVDTLQALPLPPSMIVESSPNKHHAYWILGSGEIALDDFKPLQKRLIGFFKDDGADNIHDLPRVLRLAGFYHQKQERYLTRVLYTGEKYSADALKAWVHDLPQPIEAETQQKTFTPLPTAKNRPFTDATDNASKIEDALRFISPDAYKTWYRIGAAIYSTLGESGFYLFDRWSSQSSKYNAAATSKQYRESSRLTEITIATVFKLAIDNGWKPPKQNDFENANAEILKFIKLDDSAPTFNAWDIKWIYSGLTKAKLIAELETETEQQRIFELSLELANKLSLSYPHVYSKIGIYKTIEHATQEKLKPEILNAIIDRAFYSVEKRHKNALKLVQADNWGKHTVETVETLHGVNIAYSGLIIVNAPTGYFKTEVILKQAVENAKQHDKLSITIAHRVSLIADLCDRLELSSYKEIKANKALVSVIESLGICVHSLALAPFRPFINKVSHVFIDEISQVIRCLADSTLKRHKANAIYDTLRQLIAEAECVIVADANIDQMTLNFLESCRPNETFKIVQVLPVDQGKKAVFCTDENYLLYEVARRLAEGENVWIATDSKAWAESIIASGMLAHAENMLVIDADTKEIDPKVQAFLENPNEESKKYDLIFASPTISSGVSINHNQFNFVAGYFSGKSVSPTDAYQMLGRVRQCKDYMICIPTKSYSDHGENGVINGIDEIYQQENRQLVVNDFANLYQSIITERENALLAFSESLLWILESKKITIARFTGMANHAESEYALKTTRSQLNDERKQQIIDAPCITEEQAKQIDRKELKTAEDLNALKALKIKISLGYAHSHKLTEADLALNPADLKRFNAFRGLTTVYDESAENPLSQQFNDQRAKAYKEILGNLKPDSTFGREEITAIMSYVVQHRFRFALLGIVSAKLGRIYRDKKGNVKPCTFKSPKEMTQEFFEIIKRLGLRKKDARTKESKNTNAKRLQLSDTVKSVSHVVFNTISNSVSETKTERDNLYQLDAESWAAVAIHADRLVLKNNLKPLPIVLEIRKEIAAHVANDADFDWIEPIPIQNIP
ncbi:MAG: plasmid replication protein, CyRepA1 family [Acinetobacter sp.]